MSAVEQALVRVPIWLSIALGLVGSLTRGRVQWSFWLSGAIFYSVHVAAAFAFYHDWSHSKAMEATAIQTEQLTGWHSGSGLWINYLFTLCWWGYVEHLRRRSSSPRVESETGEMGFGSLVGRVWLVFFVFMVVNGAIIFVSWPQKGLGIFLLVVWVGFFMTRKHRIQ